MNASFILIRRITWPAGDDANNYSFTYSIPCLKRPLKNRQTNILMTNGRLMKVECVAVCSSWSGEHSAILLICIKREFALKTIFCLFRVPVLDRFYFIYNILLSNTNSMGLKLTYMYTYCCANQE